MAGLAEAGCGHCAADKKAAGKCELKCPVSGEKVGDTAIDYKGGKLRFCCKDCIGEFNKNTEKYEAKANKQLVASGQAKQVACPLTGGKANEAVEVEMDGVHVHFCCGGCKAKVSKVPAEEREKLVFGANFDKGFKLQADK